MAPNATHTALLQSHSAHSRGALITLEGIDGSGKSTQLRLLAEWLRAQGHQVTESREPTGGPHGLEIRRRSRNGTLTPEAEFELFLEDRREDVALHILPALAAGHIVLLDRYYHSSIAYQGAGGLDPAVIRQANESFAPPPDLILLFDLPVEAAFERIMSRDPAGLDSFEQRARLERAAALFDAMPDPCIRRVAAHAAPGEIQEEIRRHTAELLSRHPLVPPCGNA